MMICIAAFSSVHLRAILLLGCVLAVGDVAAQGFSRSVALTYHDNFSNWVIGQKSGEAVNGVPVKSTVYDSATALPLQVFSFGLIERTIVYNPDGTVASVKNGNGEVTGLSSWRRGVPQLVTFPDGTMQSADVDDNGWLTRTIDQNGYATTYSYDAMGRLSRLDYPANDSVAWRPVIRELSLTTSIEFGVPVGHWRSREAAGNFVKDSYYDSLWRLILVREYDSSNAAVDQRFSRSAYDYAGRKVFSSYPSSTNNANSGIWTEYDSIGRVTSNSQDSELGLLVTLRRYLPGFKTSTISPAGQETISRYQVYGEPVYDYPAVIEEPEGAVTEIVRDSFGKPSSISRRGTQGNLSVTRSYVYDAHQRLCRSIEPEVGGEAMGYDNAGNVVWSARGLDVLQGMTCDSQAAYASGRRVDRAYDAMGRLKRLDFPDGNGSQAWTYTLDGLPAEVITNDASANAQLINTFSYNKRRLITSETSAQVGGHAWSIGYGYDGNGALAGMQYPSGRYIDFSPDALARPTKVGPFASAIRFHPNGAMRSFTYGNGLQHSVTQNLRQLPASITDTGAVAQTFSYDASGNVTKISDGLDSLRDQSMVYDGLNRLVTTASPAFGAGGQFSYAYDVLGNITALSLAGVRQYSYLYDGNNRVTNIIDGNGATVIGLAYDAQGNVRNKNGRSFEFDFGNRLRRVSGIVDYSYDAAGRRVISASPSGGKRLSMYSGRGGLIRQDDIAVGKSTEYMYLGSSLIAKVSTPIAPALPVAIAPGTSLDGVYSVSWGAVALAESYEMQERVDGSAWVTVYLGAALSSQLSGKASGTYSYRVRACRGGVCSDWSNVAVVSVLLVPATAPTLSAPSFSNSGSYSVNWTGVSASTSYRLEEKIDGGGWIEIHNSIVSFVGMTGKSDGFYSYRVVACGLGGCGPVSSVLSVSVVHPPAQIPAINAPAGSGDGSYTVTWSNVPGASHYQLDESFNGGAWSRSYEGNAVTRSYGSRAEAAYSYRVAACNAGGCGSPSSVANLLVQYPPATPASISLPTESYTGTYTLGWNAVPSASRYELEESTNGGGLGAGR